MNNWISYWLLIHNQTKILKCFIFFAITLTSICPALSNTIILSQDQKDEIKWITDTLCRDIPLESEKVSKQLDVRAKGKLSGLLKSFGIGAEIEGGGKISIEKSVGILSEYLSNVIKDQNECKLSHLKFYISEIRDENLKPVKLDNAGAIKNTSKINVVSDCRKFNFPFHYEDGKYSNTSFSSEVIIDKSIHFGGGVGNVIFFCPISIPEGSKSVNLSTLISLVSWKNQVDENGYSGNSAGAIKFLFGVSTSESPDKFVEKEPSLSNIPRWISCNNQERCREYSASKFPYSTLTPIFWSGMKKVRISRKHKFAILIFSLRSAWNAEDHQLSELHLELKFE